MKPDSDHVGSSALTAESLAEWVPVAERLPELRKAGQARCSNHCLVFFDDCIGIAFLLDDGRDALWRGHGGSHNMVTHWMPLPAPPMKDSPAITKSEVK